MPQWHKDKIGEANKGRQSWAKGKKFSEEHKAKISASLKGYEKTPEHKRANIEAWLTCKVSSIELKVKAQLDWYDVKYEQQKVIANGRFVVDFYLPEYKLVIECNGTYWHTRPERVERDAIVELYLTNRGIDLLWLWDYEINDEFFSITDYIEIGGRD